MVLTKGKHLRVLLLYQNRVIGYIMKCWESCPRAVRWGMYLSAETLDAIDGALDGARRNWLGNEAEGRDSGGLAKCAGS